MTPRRSKEPDPLVESLRGQVAAIRAERGWTQDDLAAYLQECGLSWDRNAVHNFEAGTRSVGPDEFFTLCAALHLSEWDLFPPKAPIALTEHLVLNQGRRPDPKRDRPGEGALQKVLAGLFEEAETAWTVESDAPRLAEERAATALGVPVADVMFAARRLWARSLPAERDAVVRERLGPMDLDSAVRQALRGRVTRELLVDLAQELKKMRAERRARSRKEA